MPMHVIQRGNNRGPCFVSEGDRLVYLALLKELAQLFPCDIHAYVLMTNHVHLLTTPRQANNVSLLMKHLGQQYVQYFNRSHRRTGSLWEGRFKSSIVDSEAYFLTCQRYIELNPVRAGLARRPSEYRWSSFRSNAGGLQEDALRPHPIYLALGKDPSTRAKRYLTLFDDELRQEELNEIRQAANGCFVLGSKAFIATLQRLMDRPVARRPPGRPKRVAIDNS